MHQKALYSSLLRHGRFNVSRVPVSLFDKMHNVYCLDDSDVSKFSNIQQVEIRNLLRCKFRNAEQKIQKVTVNRLNHYRTSLGTKHTHTLHIKCFKRRIQAFEWPPNLRKLIVDEDYIQHAFYGLPSSLTSLIIRGIYNHPLDTIGQSLTHLELGRVNEFVTKQWPPHLTHLTLPTLYTKKLKNLPDSLRYLDLGTFFDREFEIPLRLHTLISSSSYQRPLPLTCSLSLTHLEFGSLYDAPCTWQLPNLRHLEFGYAFDHPLNHLVLIHLTTLIFGDMFNQRFPQAPHLLHLTLGQNFLQRDAFSFPELLTLSAPHTLDSWDLPKETLVILRARPRKPLKRKSCSTT
jgi:hypothetical protein